MSVEESVQKWTQQQAKLTSAETLTFDVACGILLELKSDAVAFGEE